MTVREIHLAGGCFWGAQRYFDAMDGILETEVGFANGDVEAPSYKLVYTDTTGHAEAVRVRYDADVLPLALLLRRYFCAIDPLSLNRQSEDCGTRYRTGIYWSDEADIPVVQAAMAEVEAEYGGPLAVEACALKCFYPAEEYHQKYLEKTPDGYCHLPLKIFRYPALVRDLKALLDGEDDIVANLANAAALIHERMHFFWTGFYLVKDRQLVLGPFQGPIACTRIPYGKGVCGASWERASSIVVPDVEEFPGHIACSSLSRSEIVVPVFKGAEVAGVLDIDSKELGTFDRADRVWLEEAAAIISQKL